MLRLAADKVTRTESVNFILADHEKLGNSATECEMKCLCCDTQGEGASQPYMLMEPSRRLRSLCTFYHVHICSCHRNPPCGG
jgi:hypothetical protein